MAVAASYTLTKGWCATISNRYRKWYIWEGNLILWSIYSFIYRSICSSISGCPHSNRKSIPQLAISICLYFYLFLERIARYAGGSWGSSSSRCLDSNRICVALNLGWSLLLLVCGASQYKLQISNAIFIVASSQRLWHCHCCCCVIVAAATTAIVAVAVVVCAIGAALLQISNIFTQLNICAFLCEFTIIFSYDNFRFLPQQLQMPAPIASI